MKLDRIIAVRNDKTVYRDGEFCVKVFDSSHTKSDILSEALYQTMAREAGLNVPDVKRITEIDGRLSIISDYIKGQTLDSLIRDNPQRRKEYLRIFTNTQLELQSKRCPLPGRMHDIVGQAIMRTEFNATLRYDLGVRLSALPKLQKLCHGDFIPENLILDESGNVYILDWSRASLGNPAADAAISYLLMRYSGDRESADLYLDLYTSGSGIDIGRIRAWIPLAAAARTAFAHRTEREFLRPWVLGSESI